LSVTNTPSQAGILFNLYGTLSSYKIPGPSYSGIKKMARHVRDFAV
jgi:hypothetical protein